MSRIAFGKMCNGGAIPMIYNFLKQESPKAKVIFNSEPDAKSIVESMDKDKLCKESVNLFIKIYANKAADICLQKLPYGGLYLVGGVTQGLQ